MFFYALSSITEETEEPTLNEVPLDLTLPDSNSFVISHELQPYFSVNDFQYFGPLEAREMRGS